MAKREATNTKRKTSRSRKTKKRLEIKRLMLLAKHK
jgi:ribosomal protein L32